MYFNQLRRDQRKNSKNWNLITIAAPTKLFVKKDFRSWTFHEMFMNHIKNMGWLTSLVCTKSGTAYKTAKYFGQVKLETIKTSYQALELSTSPNYNMKKINYRDLYTWIFNSRDKLGQYFISEESNNHHQSGLLVWNLITTNILRGIKQVIHCAKNMLHTISPEKFHTNIK